MKNVIVGVLFSIANLSFTLWYLFRESTVDQHENMQRIMREYGPLVLAFYYLGPLACVFTFLTIMSVYFFKKAKRNAQA